MLRTLYICYFGVREPLVQTQVLPYLRELGLLEVSATPKSGKDVEALDANDPSKLADAANAKLAISLLTFESNRGVEDEAQFVKIRTEFAAEGIEWDWLPYHKRPSAIATAWDIFRGSFFIWRQIARFDVLHGRVHVPTLMAALARKFSLKRPKILFDIRGFMPEEYTDSGIWPKDGWLYRGAKRIERWLMKESDAFVVLTNRAKEILFNGSELRPVEVIPCCVDFVRRFSGDRDVMRAKYRKRLGIEGRFVILHLGALGGLYLVNEIADLLAAARERNPATFALFLTQSDPKLIEPSLAERGFMESDYFIGRADPADVEGYLHASDVGLSIVKSSFATLSRSPTKIPEYLACGLPVIANSGVGDVNTLILENGVGALLPNFSAEVSAAALAEVDGFGDIAEKCREVATREFDLAEIGGHRYRRLYLRLLNRPNERQS